MVQDDPRILNERLKELKEQSAGNFVHLEQLGKEAQGIFKSIRTETTRLSGYEQIAQSDLSYFTARHNYYKLSLMRLLPDERKMLEPVLHKFRDRILELKGGERTELRPAPFLQSLEGGAKDKPDVETPRTLILEPQKFDEVVKTEVRDSESPHGIEDLKAEILAELDLISIALTAEASNDRNRVIRGAIEKIRTKIN